jgi:hypothetical protein
LANIYFYQLIAPLTSAQVLPHINWVVNPPLNVDDAFALFWKCQFLAWAIIFWKQPPIVYIFLRDRLDGLNVNARGLSKILYNLSEAFSTNRRQAPVGPLMRFIERRLPVVAALAGKLFFKPRTRCAAFFSSACSICAGKLAVLFYYTHPQCEHNVFITVKPFLTQAAARAWFFFSLRPLVITAVVACLGCNYCIWHAYFTAIFWFLAHAAAPAIWDTSLLRARRYQILGLFIALQTLGVAAALIRLIFVGVFAGSFLGFVVPAGLYFLDWRSILVTIKIGTAVPAQLLAPSSTTIFAFETSVRQDLF